MTEQLKTADRKAAEQEYTINSFDYASNPVGSRDWCLFWQGWQARASQQVPEWISVEERLPEDGQVVLVHYYESGPHIDCWHDECWSEFEDHMQHYEAAGFGACPKPPTHWMPLPAAPAGGETEKTK